MKNSAYRGDANIALLIVSTAFGTTLKQNLGPRSWSILSIMAGILENNLIAGEAEKSREFSISIFIGIENGENNLYISHFESLLKS